MKVRNIDNCSRCGGRHDELEAKKFDRPHACEENIQTRTWTHWAMCPTSGDPIMVRNTTEEEDETDAT
jgi:hypothetical protein